jgi:hypothetical protein
VFTLSIPRRLLTSAAALAAACAAGLGGGAAPAALAATCPPPPTPVYPFGPDTGYVMTTGGDFGTGSQAWTLTGGAPRVADQAPDVLFAPANSFGALYLPPGSSATSPCVTAPGIVGWVRPYVKSVGASGGLLSVQIIVHGTVYSAGIVTAGAGWAPTPLLQSDAPLYKGAVTYQVRLTPIGPGAAFDVDDVWIDPLMHR